MNEETIWSYLKAKGLNDFGVAGLMGNLFAESGLNPRNLQNSYEAVLGMNDNAYVAAVDNGTYKNFVRDKAGFGLAQWTYWSRKDAFLTFVKASGTSIGDLDVQLDFLWKELSESYSGVLRVLCNATSVLEASNAVLLNFERPANQGTGVQKKRAEYGQTYYNKYANSNKEVNPGMSNSPLVSYTKLSPNNSGKRNHVIDTISIHCTAGNKNNTAAQIANLERFLTYDPDNGASCNYAVGGDGSIALCVDEGKRSWCTSSGTNDHRAVTIEVASNKSGTEVNEKAYAALLDLVTDICKRNGIKRLLWSTNKNERVNHLNGCNMTVHRDYAPKSCPGEWLYSRHGQIAAEVNKRLGIKNTETEDDDMDVARFKELWGEMRKELQDNDSGKYSEEARAWATSTGLIAGNGTEINGEPNYMWADVLTREQFVTVLYRFAQMMGKV